jgi:redox-sensitive bicupin YhaK (pirin superfamily)
MSAGTGIVHSEHNREKEPTTLFQIWIRPTRTGEAPSWGQREFPRETRTGQWEVVASGDPERDDALPLRADAKVLAANLAPGQSAQYATDSARNCYLVAASGRIRVNGIEAQARDGIAISGESSVLVEAIDQAELVLVDTE